MNKLTIAKIYLGLLALGLVIWGVLNPATGLPVLFGLSFVTLVFGLAWALTVVFEDMG
jgi:membrane-anchored protein YejM (alkaline phosphatase superfamily)